MKLNESPFYFEVVKHPPGQGTGEILGKILGEAHDLFFSIEDLARGEGWDANGSPTRDENPKLKPVSEIQHAATR